MMQQQILEKKKEIINSFLKKGILVSSDLLSKLNDDRHISKIFEILKANDEDITVADFDIHNLLEKAKQQETKPEQKTASENKVEIIYSYKEESKKREAQDFVAYFNIRYKSIEKILKHHQELKNTISISRLTAKKEQVSIIGMVSAKQTTKNGNLLLMVEDPTGQRRVLVNKNKPSLFREAQSIVLDEVIGIVGTNVDTLMFANNIVWPEAPNTKELRKMDEEKYAIFLSDIHVGSTNFLPDEFEKFLKWINGEAGNETQKNIAKKVHYIFIAGDLVDGVGIYPGQEEELTIKDIYEQYKECARLLDKIPKRIKLIISPGNHDAMRLAEPQPLLSKEFAKPLHELSNVIMVSNPALLNINATEDFPGFDVLMYHGYSFDYFVAQVDSLRNQGGYNRADLIMKFLLKRRHLAPSHLSTQYIPSTKNDALTIDRVPDFLLSGHIHKSVVANHKNTTLISGSCWQSKTSFQEKVGHNPEPSRVPIVNLKTRDVKILKFGQ